VIAGDALAPACWTPDLDTVVIGFALDEVPWALIGRLRDGAVVVAPIALEGAQRLARIRAGEQVEIEWHDAVRYVPAQRAAPQKAPAPAAAAARRRLPLA